MDKDKPKRISVILPVYNSEKTLKEAIDSILNQTYECFELIIINDGSTDLSEKIITSYKDKRIVYKSNYINKGLIYTLNYALSISKYEYIARMDADDISKKDRFNIQLNYLDSHPDIIAVGSSRILFGEGIKKRKQAFPNKSDDIKAYMYMANPIIHPSIMIRKSILSKYNIKYDPAYPHMEDYKFWYDLIKVGKIVNISKPLILYRISKEQITSKFQKEQSNKNKTFRRKIINSYLNKINIEINDKGINWGTINFINKQRNKLLNHKITSTILFVLCLSLIEKENKDIFLFFKSGIWYSPYFKIKYTLAILLDYLNIKSYNHFAI